MNYRELALRQAKLIAKGSNWNDELLTEVKYLRERNARLNKELKELNSSLAREQLKSYRLERALEKQGIVVYV